MPTRAETPVETGTEAARETSADTVADILLGYVPRLAFGHVLALNGPLTNPHTEQLPCAVLFADISGFTALTERLAEEGPEGVERLTTVLNDYFGRMVDAIENHGGDVVKFAGDGLLALWPATVETPLSACVAVATRCAARIQAELRDYDPKSDGGEQLSMKIGVGAGDILALHVGGVFRRWEFAVCGEPVTQVEAINGVCAPGEVGISAAARALLGEAADCEDLGKGCFRVKNLTSPVTLAPVPTPSLSAEQAEWLKSLIPAAIHRRVEAGQNVWLAELRRITVLFVNLPQLTGNTPVEEAHRAMRALQTALYSYEGSVNKLSVDDKGVSLIAALGLPPLSHTDDPARGALAALAMQNDLQALGWECSIGVTTGRVFCGTIGNDRRREYTIMGDVVNLSARLMQAARGGILVDAETADSADAAVEFAPLDPIRVKGKEAPVAIFQPRGERAPDSVEAADLGFVGRHSERSQLVDSLTKLLNGEAGAAIVEGAPGVGKTRFAAELTRAAEARDIRVLRTAADGGQRSTAYFAWTAVLRTLLDLNDATPEEAQNRVMAHAHAIPELTWLAPLLNAVLPTRFASTSLTEQMESEARRDTLLSLCVEILTHCSDGRATLVMLEDGQWLDEASWLLVERAAHDVPWVMPMVITRPLSEPLPSGFATLRDDIATVSITLAPLTHDETLTLAKERLGVRVVRVELANLLHERSGGNPFFLEALIDTLTATGQLRIVDDAAEFDDQANDEALPDSLEALVMERLDRLAPSVQLTLKVASVIGHMFDLNLLRTIHPVAAEHVHLEQHLKELCEIGLVDPRPERAGTFTFRNALVRDVTYNLMLFSHRRHLHASIAGWYQEAETQTLALLAHHWYHADDADRAVHYSVLAGEEAAANFANRQTVEFFSRALEIDSENGSPDPMRRARWTEALGNAYYAQGDFDASREALREALTFYDRALPSTAMDLRLSLLSAAAAQVRRLVFRRKDRPVDPRLESASRILSRLGQLNYLDNRQTRGIYAAMRGLNLAIDSGSMLEQSRHYANMTVVAGLVGLHRIANLYAERALRNAERAGDNGARAYVLNIVGLYRATQGQWFADLNCLRPAQDLASSMGHHRRWEETSIVLVNSLYRQGRLHDARRLARKLYLSGRQRSVRAVQCWGIANQIIAELALALPMQDLAERLAGLVNNSLPDGDRILSHGVLALAAWHGGDTDVAATEVERATTLMARTDTTVQYVLGGYAGVAEVAVETVRAGSGEIAGAERILDIAVDALQRYMRLYPVGAPLWHRFAGHRAQLRGSDREAAKLWTAGIERARRLGMVYEQGCLHRTLAAFGPEQESAVQTGAAQKCFEQTHLDAGEDEGKDVTKTILWL